MRGSAAQRDHAPAARLGDRDGARRSVAFRKRMGAGSASAAAGEEPRASCAARPGADERAHRPGRVCLGSRVVPRTPLMFVDVGDLRIAYERAGEGPPVVLVHGYVGDAITTWRHQLENLSAEFMVIAWDNPGSGRSDDPPESFALADFADCLARFVRAVGVERPHVVGLSFGGGLSLELYRRHPSIPRSLVLADTYAG